MVSPKPGISIRTARDGILASHLADLLQIGGQVAPIRVQYERKRRNLHRCYLCRLMDNDGTENDRREMSYATHDLR